MWTRLGLFDGRPESRRAALLDFCAETLGVGRKKLALAHDPLGAPLLLFDGARCAWNVSSSSREDVFLFGLVRGAKIGVDVEVVRLIDLPEAVLHSGERRRLVAMPDMLRVNAFYDLWTAKEAYLKALGVGLRRDPSDIRVTAEGAGLEIADHGHRVTLAASRTWRESVGEKTAICSVLTLGVLSPAK